MVSKHDISSLNHFGDDKLWVHFNLLCDGETQQKLHKIFRHKIRDWKKRELVKDAVLTYHFQVPSVQSDSLYVCLDIPSIKKPLKRSVQLPKEIIDQIPSTIMNNVKQVCDQKGIELQIRDYEFALTLGKSGRHYRNASIEQILRFASVGTKIALQILDAVEIGEQPWTSDKELATFILSQLKKELGEKYSWLPESFHFVCNPLLLNDSYFWILAHAEASTNAIDSLYRGYSL